MSESLQTLLANSSKFFSMLSNNGIPDFRYDNVIPPASVGSNSSGFGLSVIFENEIHIGTTDDDSMAKLDRWGKSIVDQAVKKVFETQVNQSLLGGGIPVRNF